MINSLTEIGLGLLLASGIRLLFYPHYLKKILGIGLINQAINLLLLFSTAPELALDPPRTSTAHFETLNDPLPQAMILTSIVIGTGVSVLILVSYLVQQKLKEELTQGEKNK